MLLQPPDDFPTVALDKGVAALQTHYRASYNTVLRWLHELPTETQELRRITVPLGRKGGQAAIVRDDSHSINASDTTARNSAESGTLALEAKYIAAAERNSWIVREDYRVKP